MNDTTLNRYHNLELDSILGQKFPVLDDGFIRLIDYMGGDESIVQAARVSYGQGTKKIHEDTGLIRYLMRHQHTTPFEMCELKLHVRVPMDCWRQWVRHRTSNINEYSTRYSLAIDAAQTTPSEQWRLQSTQNRQGSQEERLAIEQGQLLSQKEQDLHAFSREVYQERLALGVAREQARKDLPLATYTEAYWKIDLHNLLHFLALRMDTHAQLEIRNYAQIIGEEIVARWCPITWQAFQDYRLQRMVLSGRETQLLNYLARQEKEAMIILAQSYGWLDEEGIASKRNRERSEFENKMECLGWTNLWQK